MASEKITYPAVVDNLPLVTEFVEGWAVRSGLETKKTFGLLIAVEEAFVNICSYAFPDGGGEAEFLCEIDGETLLLEITDSGIPFNVLSLPQPETTSDIVEREIGGLGGHFIRKLTDDAVYRRENGMNILRLVTFLNTGSAPSP
jgi:anti-sigma regulatory factor (Ser/Thr protein kinase)